MSLLCQKIISIYLPTIQWYKNQFIQYENVDDSISNNRTKNILKKLFEYEILILKHDFAKRKKNVQNHSQDIQTARENFATSAALASVDRAVFNQDRKATIICQSH